jgi:hypothetical protein
MLLRHVQNIQNIKTIRAAETPQIYTKLHTETKHKRDSYCVLSYKCNESWNWWSSGLRSHAISYGQVSGKHTASMFREELFERAETKKKDYDRASISSIGTNLPNHTVSRLRINWSKPATSYSRLNALISWKELSVAFQRARHCATNRQVAGSIPDGVTEIFRWHNPSGRTMALGSTQPLIEMSTRNISWG